MYKNWFRNEALYILLPLPILLLIALFVTFYHTYFNPLRYELAFAEEKVEPDFNQDFLTGYSFGTISSNEVQILRVWGALKYHVCNDEDSKKNKCWSQDSKVSTLNTHLIAIYIFMKEVPEDVVIPIELKEIIISGSETSKKLYSKLKKQRIENGWIHKDPEIEKKINEVLDLYIEYGNPYKLK